MMIEVSYDELFDISNALRHRADVFKRMPALLEPELARSLEARGRESSRPLGQS